MYNRASADLDGKPWDSTRPGITWNGSKWVGDVPDYPATMDPHDPNAWLPFIMNGEGVGRLFSNSMVDGPFPEHYEPVESPVANPLHAANSASPVAFLYDKAAGRPNRFGTAADFPYIATSYRLTEHEHYVTQHVPHLVQLQPRPFVEIPDELAREKGIKSRDRGCACVVGAAAPRRRAAPAAGLCAAAPGFLRRGARRAGRGIPACGRGRASVAEPCRVCRGGRGAARRRCHCCGGTRSIARRPHAQARCGRPRPDGPPVAAGRGSAAGRSLSGARFARSRARSAGRFGPRRLRGTT